MMEIWKFIENDDEKLNIRKFVALNEMNRGINHKRNHDLEGTDYLLEIAYRATQKALKELENCFKSYGDGIIPNDETSKCLHNLAVIEWKLVNNGHMDYNAREKMKQSALNDLNQAIHMKERLYEENTAHPSVEKSQYLYDVIIGNKKDDLEPELEAQLSFSSIEMLGGC